MKVLFISYNGALEPHVQSQGIPYLRGLVRRGVECTLLTFEKLNKANRADFKRKVDKLKKELEAQRIRWYHLRYHKRPSFLVTVFDIFAGTIFSLYILISKRIDIVHARSLIGAIMGCMAARLTGKKFIFDPRGIMSEEYIDGGMWKKQSLIYRTALNLEKGLLNNSDALVVLTKNIKDFLINTDYLPKRFHDRKKDITVIPCCVDTERFNTLQTPSVRALRERYGLSGKFVFLYSGSIGSWYLLEEMIDFFLAAKSVIKNAHFLVLAHVNKEVVRDSWKRRGLSFSDITIREVEFEEMPNFVKLADVGLFLIKPAFSKRSSCPIKFAEYLAGGLPVVINSGIGDTDSIVEKYKLGIVVRDFCKESYLDALNKLSELSKESDKLSARCQRAAKEFFSLEKGTSEYFSIYNKVLTRP